MMSTIIFTFSAGCLLSFIFSPIFFKKLSHRIVLYMALSITYVTFIVFYLLCFIEADTERTQQGKHALVGLVILVNGFFSACMQSKLAGTAASYNYREIINYNIGTGISGVSTGVIAYSLHVFLPIKDFEDPLPELKS